MFAPHLLMWERFGIVTAVVPCPVTTPPRYAPSYVSCLDPTLLPLPPLPPSPTSPLRSHFTLIRMSKGKGRPVIAATLGNSKRQSSSNNSSKGNRRRRSLLWCRRRSRQRRATVRPVLSTYNINFCFVFILYGVHVYFDFFRES